MNYRQLGGTGLKVSEIGFGCGNVGGLIVRGDPKERVRTVARAIELGINYFDTAPAYGEGVSERNLGLVLKELKADVVVSTKVGLLGDELADIRGNVFKSVDTSLGLLGQESVDLIQLHNRITFQHDVPKDAMSVDEWKLRDPIGIHVEDALGEVVDALQEIQRQGKTRHFGITGLGETAAVHNVMDSGTVATVQACYNLLNPSAGSPMHAGFDGQDFGALIDKAHANDMGVIVISVLAEGALTGVVSRHPVAERSVTALASRNDYAEDVKRAGEFGFLVDQGHAESLVEGAIRFALTKEEVSTVLVGFSSMEQLEKGVEYASNGPLPSEVMGRLSDVWGRFSD